MANVIFYEKPGCASNAKQKALLIASGHRVDARDLLREPWSASSLRPFFGEKPVREWFNAASPRVKSGEVNPDRVNPQEAIVMMILDPGLIRRPLMRIGDHCESGFDPAQVRRWIGLEPEAEGVTDRCAMDAA
ncbi:ArsC/Spx/MgsR family protein [Methylocystis echinoides]|jgi:nitrogenase-associated protein|uniref:ArsC/Spx/MgsR family protein n=1 Tax=Methylocystis echinoides TaxID=29468 RepID=UPI0034171952